MVTKKIEELEQLPISLLPDNWPLAVKLAWQDNTNTTNITSETLNLNLSETERIRETQSSQASQLGILSQDVQSQGQEVAAAKDEAAKALQASTTNKTDIKSNLTAIQNLQNEIKNLPTDDKLQKEVEANANDIIKLKNEIQNLPTDAKLEQEVQANKTNIATNATDIADNLTALQKLQEDVKNGLGFPGTDYVVEYKKFPTGFYRLYASGYCEQGGSLRVSNMTGTYLYGGEYPYWRPLEVMDGLVLLGETLNATSSIRCDISTAVKNSEKTHFRVYLRTYAGARVDNDISYIRWYAAGITAKPPKAPDTPYTPTELEAEIQALKAAMPSYPTATGGRVWDGDGRTILFESSDKFTVTKGGKFKVTVIGGGGGGCGAIGVYSGFGGGGGGVSVRMVTLATNASIDVIVGNGGNEGQNGGPSQFDNIHCKGGSAGVGGKSGSGGNGGSGDIRGGNGAYGGGASGGNPGEGADNYGRGAGGSGFGGGGGYGGRYGEGGYSSTAIYNGRIAQNGATTGNNGGNGGGYGGGGGGGGDTTGGNGAPGAVIIEPLLGI